MNYWFLYNLIDGSIYGSPYLGYTDNWTNIPEGCGVVGPFKEEEATDIVKQAFVNPVAHKIVNNELVFDTNYVAPIPGPQPPSMEGRLSALEDAITALMGV